MTVESSTAPRRGFVPALEGVRAAAALGVVLTHVAFQTGTTAVPVVGRLLGRFDLAVAVFFALSGFLLWRPHAAAARGLGATAPWRTYLLSRAVRIVPAYLVVVVVVLALLPPTGAELRVWVANLSFSQVYVPLTLAQGLTQMWSLSVEVAFYLALPLIAAAMASLAGSAARHRIPVILAAVIPSLGWGFLPIPVSAGTSLQNWLPGYLAWFAAGMIVAELACSAPADRQPGRSAQMRRFMRRRGPMTVIGLVAFGLSATDLAGPEGLVAPAPWQFAIKIALGGVVAFALLAPIVLGGGEHRWLAGTVGRTLGRWSYGIFLWHLAVLAVVFPSFAIVPFSGSFVTVLVLTVLLTIPVASASYALVEEPSRRALARWKAGRSARAATATAATETNAAP